MKKPTKHTGVWWKGVVRNRTIVNAGFIYHLSAEN
jgi:hypothetical protein